MTNHRKHSKVVCALSVSRSDLGRMALIYKQLMDQPEIDFRLIMAGAHVFSKFGEPHTHAQELGLIPNYLISHQSGSSPENTSTDILQEVHSILRTSNCDYLLLMGDRFEMLAASQAALLAGVPILHVGGGHLTQGAIDEQCRHALTKLANRHYVACDQHENRLRQMGEEPESILNVGAPDIDGLLSVAPIARNEFCETIGLNQKLDFILVTLHPETHDKMNFEEKVRALFSFLAGHNSQVLITAPCQDDGCELIFQQISHQVKCHPTKFIYHPQLGESLYVNAMHHCEYMLGNSSSGIIESGSVGVPVINVGERQRGRVRPKNVIDCDWDKESLEKALQALRSLNLSELKNPYGDGKSCKRIAADILALPKTMTTAKRFIDSITEQGKLSA